MLIQDNKSIIQMQNNGRMSCSKRTKHINVRYFNINDMIKRERTKVTHCPTEEIIANFFTKPLQGSLFQKSRQVIMGHVSINSLLDNSDKSNNRVGYKPNAEKND